ADTVALPPGQAPGAGGATDTSALKTITADLNALPGRTPPPGQLPPRPTGGDTGSMKTLINETPSAARTPTQAGGDTGSMKTLINDTPSGVRTPSQAGDTGSLKTLINPNPSAAQSPSQVLGDTSQMRTLINDSSAGTPSHPTGDIGNMATLVSDVSNPPSAVRTGSHPGSGVSGGSGAGTRPGSRPGSHPSGLKTPSGARFPISGSAPGMTPSGSRFPVSGGSGNKQTPTGSSGVLAAGMATGKRWTPSPEDIAEVHADNQLGNLQPVENGRILGQYVLMKKLGQGGMGAVYRGIKMGLNTDVAIKILFAHLAAAKGGSDHQARFLREAQLAASLDHGNLVRVIDVQQDFNSGILYLVMEFVEGHSVADLLKDRAEPLPEEEGLELIIGACKGLRAAHLQSIVHRDIKPDNIMIRARDKVVKVADMGLAKAIGDQDEVSVSRTESVIGTPAYMAPEQARDSKHVDLRADIYSMGATLFHMTTLRLPFEDPQLFMLLKKVITEPVPDPRTYNEKLSENLSRIIKKCMAKQPDNRYQRIDELIVDLEIALRNIRGEKDAVVDDLKLVVPEMEPEAPTPWYKHWVTFSVAVVVLVCAAMYGAYYFASGGLSPFEQAHKRALEYIQNNSLDKADSEIAAMEKLKATPGDQKEIDAVKNGILDKRYADDMADGVQLLNRDKKYTEAQTEFEAAQKLHDTPEVRKLIDQAKLGPFTDTILHLISTDVNNFDGARAQLAAAAKALGQGDTWIAQNDLTGKINLAEAKFRVNQQIALVGQPNADEQTVETAKKVAAEWLLKTGTNPQISALIDDLKKLAVRNVYQPQAENELRQEQFDLVPKSIAQIGKLSPGDPLIDSLTTRLNDAKLAKTNRERREKADQLIADAEKLLASKSFESIAETQDLKLLNAVKQDYVNAQNFEDAPRDSKGDILRDDKGRPKLRRSDLGASQVQDMIDRYNQYQSAIQEGHDRLEFQRYDDAITAYIGARKIINTDQVAQLINEANNRKSTHEAIQNLETTIATDPVKAATYLQDKLEKVPNDPDLGRVKQQLLKVTRPADYELPDLQIRFKLIPAGTFNMGSNDGNEDEKPVHKVRLKYPFYMSVTEVTVKQYEALIPGYKRPLDASGNPVPDDMPVTGVSWEDAVRYAQLLTDREKVKLREHEIYRLPTEAEWEYACRSGKSKPYHWHLRRKPGDTSGEAACIVPPLPMAKVGSYPP
ncbi:MAG: protein kinase domain-containing protein, partial [Planctomycetota bacterium]